MRYPDLIEYYRSVTKAGEAIKKRRQTVHRWKRSGIVPLEHQVDFELATDGKLRADLPDTFIEVAARRIKERRIKLRRAPEAKSKASGRRRK